jgi:hypothetical protein
MNLNITVLAVTKASAMSKANKPYQLVEIAYKNNTFQGKVESIKINQYSDLYSTVAGMQAGQSWEIVKEKVGEFWNWTKATQAPPGSAVEASTEAPSKAPYTPPAKVVSTYETSIERAAKQVFIIRQSSLSSAVNCLVVGAKHPPTFDAVAALADQFFAYVMQTPEAEAKKDVFSLPNDIEVE